MITLESVDKIFCRYVNQTSQFHILRIANIPNWFFERTVIPETCILFETFRDAWLEVHTGMMATSTLSEIILCERLAQISDVSAK